MTVGTFFNGTTHEILLGSNDFTMTSTFSVWGMVYINTMTTQRYIIAAMNGATPVVAVRFDSGNLVIDSGADSPPWFTAVSPTTWYFFCITKGAGTVAPKAYLTADGSSWTLDATAAGAGTLSNLASGVITDFRIGSVLASNYWNGEIAALGISNLELSGATAKGLIDYSTWAGISGQQFNSGQSMINGGTVDDLSSVNNDEASRVGTTAGAQTIPAWFTNFGGGPVPPTPITMQQVGTTSAGGTTSLTIPYPVTGLAAGDLFLVGRTVKPSTATVTTPPSPFTALANTTGGTGTQGIDTGPQRLSTEYLISPSGAESGNLTTAQAGTPDSALGKMIRFRRPPGTYWATPIVATADDNSHGTARSAAAGSTIDVREGDMLVAFFGSDTDTTTAFTSATFTGTGLTTGTVTIDQGAGGVATGQDSGIYLTHALVTAGTGATTITATLAGGPSSCGPIHIIRLRAIYPVHYGREYQSMGRTIMRVPHILRRPR